MSRPSVLTVVSCGETKIDLDPGESVPARELYDSSVHTCKDRYGRHSDGYYIMSAEYGLVHSQTELAYYDRTLDEMSDLQVRAWGRRVALTLQEVALEFDAVVLIGSETYVGALKPHFDRIPATVLTPWQTSDYVTGVGRGMAWCNDELNWPENVSPVGDIGEIVSAGIASIDRPV
ncbi:DUF6884 domain-containing protein [Natrialba asiatica]|uniref:DUF6884 domain-containing protein n=1 Tax=Natrialba asiatica (strain ATCC 700177 / DSM 12278 / JCM 9576 / FERM P-10747 / NBRC 102637 / 172P1) TaxID=29540 RepID=M0B322_NATA1|nr:DUF6884 domain-containing protein [Natrialba asiatica]ELZ04947.1 hypothetical protein C481_03322 [Natrialba asiatica DSM 12278]